ncbi:30S ribosomal protein S4e [Candidatus Woesearchaeota archaeon]|nr:30S ribosomal protein S4e [Candidatus Woesearchaeota archaeon]
MGQQHLARLAAPDFWQMKRKERKWILRPQTGSHSYREALPLGLILREMLQLAKTLKEVKFILNQGVITVDKVVRKDPHFAVGFMDVVEITSLKQAYRVVLDAHGRFVLLPVSGAETEFKLLKVVGKTMARKQQLQCTFADGRNVVATKAIAVGDTAYYNLTTKNIQDVLPMKPGYLAYFIGGSHQGTLGVIKEILRGKDLQKPKVAAEQNGVTFITPMRYALIVGKEKPLLNLTL